MQIPNIFTSFSPKLLLAIFLVKSKLSTAKKSKTAAFSRVFTQNNSTMFLGKSKLNFLDKKWRFRTVCLESNWNRSFAHSSACSCAIQVKDSLRTNRWLIRTFWTWIPWSEMANEVISKKDIHSKTFKTFKLGGGNNCIM